MERLQKVLARAGIASRRAAEQIILAGRVRVDGRIVTELGSQVDPRKSRVEVDGTKIVAEKLVYIVLHKPRGVVCTLSDPEGRPTIKELIKDAGARLVPVGRLDFHTSGALLCTNDGEFAQALSHPKREVPKVYVAKVKGTVDDDALPRFGESLEIDGRPTQPAQVKRLRYEGDKTWLEITLREGRNRQVRRLGEATGFPVMRLARVSHAGVTSEDLRPGQWRELSADELVDLKKVYGVPKKVRSPTLETVKGRGGSTSRFDKRTPRAEGRGPKKAAAAEVRGEHWSRESSRDVRLKRDDQGKPGARAPSPREDRRGPRAGRDEMASRSPAGRTGVSTSRAPAGRGPASRAGAGPSRGGAGPSRAGAGPSRTSAGPSRTSAGPSRGGASPSRGGAGPSRGGAGPSRTGAGPSRSSSNRASGNRGDARSPKRR